MTDEQIEKTPMRLRHHRWGNKGLFTRKQARRNEVSALRMISQSRRVCIV